MSRTATRAFVVLESVIHSSTPLGLMEIAEVSGVDKSTTQRLLSFLVEIGMLTRDESTKRYGVGSRAFAMAAAVNSRNDLRVVAAPYFHELRERSGESVSLHLGVAGRRVCIDGLESLQPIRRVVPLGESLPLYLGPSGKVILANQTPERSNSLLDGVNLSADETAHLNRDLRFARENGYLLTESDRSADIRALSAPIFDSSGVTASLTIAGPSDRWSQDDALACVPAILHAADAISASLGGRK
ncbi:IclR family transcriptional regulator [Herbiconiux sp. P17]|uniref:IclR family transcriptional regulator n=1 Tax=Herbiconiux wuyangfengii TaxID=3342794 RepID=UPI0035B9302B